jgi:hypothetical protein
MGGDIMALVGWWPLDGNTDDYSVNNNTGVNNNVTFVNGKIGQAGSFNGTSSFINVSGSYVTSLITSTVNKHFSISVWIKPTNIGTDQAIVSQRHGDAMSLFLLSNGKVTFEMDDTQNYQGTNTVLQNNNWYNIVVTFFNSGSSSYVKYYVNGTFEKQETKWDGNGISANSNLWIGWQSRTDYGRNPGFFNGQINDVRLYDYILSQKEINELAKAKVLQYNFNKDDGNIVYDGNGLKRYATVIGATWTENGYDFNGSNTKLLTTDPHLFRVINSDFTLSSWIYIDSAQANAVTIAKRKNTNPFQQIIFGVMGGTDVVNPATAGTRIRLYLRTDGFNHRGAYTDNLDILNKWTHIAASYSFVTNQIKIWVNGVLQTLTYPSNANAGTFTGIDIDEPVEIGACNHPSVGFFNGIINEPKIYMTALSDANILDLYQTRAKIDNQGNLYANEFVEDYEVAPGLTLTQLFGPNQVTALPNTVELGTFTETIGNSRYYTGNNTSYFLYTFNRSMLIGRKYYVVLKTFTDRSGPQRLWFRRSGTNLNSQSISQSQDTGFKIDSALIAPTSFDFATYAKVYDSPRVVGDRYAYDTTSHYFIDLSGVFGIGNEPTKEQMDVYYRDYSQSRTKSNGQIITNEFSEVDSPSQAMKIFKDKIHIQGSLNEGGQ